MAKRVLKTTEEVAEILSVSPITVQRMAASNEIPARKVAGRWRFDSGELDAWLKTNNTDADDTPTAESSANDSEMVSQLKRVGDRLDDINKSIKRVGVAIQKKGPKNGRRSS